jgi:hypothetical protein
MCDRDQLLSCLDESTRIIFSGLSEAKKKLVLGNWHELDDPATLVRQLHRKRSSPKSAPPVIDSSPHILAAEDSLQSHNQQQQLQRQQHWQELQELEQRQQQRRRDKPVSTSTLPRKESAPVIVGGSGKSHAGKSFANTLATDGQTAAMFHSLSRSKQTMIKQNWSVVPYASIAWLPTNVLF